MIMAAKCLMLISCVKMISAAFANPLGYIEKGRETEYHKGTSERKLTPFDNVMVNIDGKILKSVRFIIQKQKNGTHLALLQLGSERVDKYTWVLQDDLILPNQLYKATPGPCYLRPAHWVNDSELQKRWNKYVDGGKEAKGLTVVVRRDNAHIGRKQKVQKKLEKGGNAARITFHPDYFEDFELFALYFDALKNKIEEYQSGRCFIFEKAKIDEKGSHTGNQTKRLDFLERTQYKQSDVNKLALDDGLGLMLGLPKFRVVERNCFDCFDKKDRHYFDTMMFATYEKSEHLRLDIPRDCVYQAVGPDPRIPHAQTYKVNGDDKQLLIMTFREKFEEERFQKAIDLPDIPVPDVGGNTLRRLMEQA